MDVEKEDPLTAAKRLLERICVDLENEISVHRVERPEDEVVVSRSIDMFHFLTSS